MSPQTVTGLETGWTLDSSNRISRTCNWNQAGQSSRHAGTGDLGEAGHFISNLLIAYNFTQLLQLRFWQKRALAHNFNPLFGIRSTTHFLIFVFSMALQRWVIVTLNLFIYSNFVIVFHMSVSSPRFPQPFLDLLLLLLGTYCSLKVRKQNWKI